jgi:hypothetical protein
MGQGVARLVNYEWTIVDDSGIESSSNWIVN